MRHGTRPALMALVLTLVAVAPTGAQSVEKSSISFMLDWTIAGTHAPYFIPLDKGYYKAEGLNVKIDRGTGAGNTASHVASGVYDFGWADVTTLIAFDAQNPTKELTLVYISFQDAPLAIVSFKSTGITTLKDLQGTTVADQHGSAAGAVINVVTKAGTPEEIKINRKFVTPQLREPMLIRRDVDAILAFDVSSIMTLVDLGVPRDQISVLRYADIGFDVYGTGLWVRRDFLEKNPRTVAAMVRHARFPPRRIGRPPRSAAAGRNRRCDRWPRGPSRGRGGRPCRLTGSPSYDWRGPAWSTVVPRAWWR